MVDELLEEAAKEAEVGLCNCDGGPFGAVIADADGKIISRGHNIVLSSHDPTNHAEIVAIREACKKLKTHDLSNYTIYSSCEPCPMCLSAIIWSNIKLLYFGATRDDASKIGFRDGAIYDYLASKNHILDREERLNVNCREVLKNYEGEIY